MTAKDDNGSPVLYGVSHLDGRTLVKIKFTSAKRMGVDTVTTIAFDPAVNASRTDNDGTIAKATSLDDNSLVLPWVVNATTGKVLVDL